MFMFIYSCVAIVLLWAVRALYIRRKLPKGAKWLPGPPGRCFRFLSFLSLFSALSVTRNFIWLNDVFHTGLPVIGRVWDIPRQHSYLRFKQWSDIYGPIFQINVFGVNHIWLASDKIAQDLLVKRGNIYSDRPPINNLKDSKTAGEYIPLLGHNGD